MHPAEKVIDVITAGTILATFAGWLPPTAALLACIWYAILIYDRVRQSFKARKDTACQPPSIEKP